MTYSVSPIGYVRSCFKEKFAIPRQPQLAPALRAAYWSWSPLFRVRLQGLEQVSHVWLLFVFHQALEDKPRLKVRPPRLGATPRWGSSRPALRIVRMVLASPWSSWTRSRLTGCISRASTCLMAHRFSISNPMSHTRYIIASASNCMASAAPVLIPVIWTDTALQQAHTHGLRLQEPLN